MEMTTNDFLKEAKGFLEDAIERVYTQYKSTKGRKDRSDMKAVYEELVRMDTIRCGFRRWSQLK